MHLFLQKTFCSFTLPEILPPFHIFPDYAFKYSYSAAGPLLQVEQGSYMTGFPIIALGCFTVCITPPVYDCHAKFHFLVRNGSTVNFARAWHITLFRNITIALKYGKIIS